jgi:phosphodiesterase/alkaline phosphatase D-like protein
LVVRKVGSASTFTPTNNTSYTLGQDIGDGVVAYSGTTFLFNETGLTPDTQYFYRVFAYNQVSTSISYLTTSPLQSNVRTVALEPTAQPTNLQFAFVTDVGFTVSYTAAAGSPAGYLYTAT